VLGLSYNIGMKLDRSQFPPLTEKDFLCEYELSRESMEEFMQIMKMPPEKWPTKLKAKIPKTWFRKPK